MQQTQDQDDAGIIQPREEMTHVRLAPADGGVYLVQVVDTADDASQRVYIPEAEVSALVTALQRYLAEQCVLLGEAVEEGLVWRVTGTILYDDPDGEEHVLDLDMMVAALDEAEALRVTLEQLQAHYMGAAWDGMPSVELMHEQ